MDGAILLIAANESCPQPQTREHLQALEIVGVKTVVVVQNKVDVVSEEQAQKNYDQINEFLKDSSYRDAPVIPMSALHSINLDYLLFTIEQLVPTPQRNTTAPPLMFVARSFDINRPGAHPQRLQGGVLGGVLKQGVLKEGQNVEIRPGASIKEGKEWKTLMTKIVSLTTGGEHVQEVGPGGTFALLTGLDPSIVKSDQLVGSAVGTVGQLPPVWNSFTLEVCLLDRVVGTKDKLVVDPIKKGEMLMLNVNSAATVGVVSDLGKKECTVALKRPVCTEVGSRVTISRRLGQRWRLIGYGIIKKNL